MKRFSYALLAIGLFVSSAHAVVIFEDNFDSYADQAALDTSWDPVGCSLSGIPASCTVTAPYPGNLLNSADFPERGNTLLNTSPAAPSPGTLNNAQRNQKVIPATPTLEVGDKLVFSFDFYDITPTNAPFREFISIQSSAGPAATPAGQLIAMGLNNNQAGSASGGQFYMARILGYTVPTTDDPDGGPIEAVGGSGAFFKLNDFSTGTGTGPGARSVGWHNLKAEISTDDNVDTDYNFYVDDVLAEHVNVVGTPRTYTHLRIGSGLSSTSDVYFDNFRIEHILAPPPGGVTGDYNDDDVVDAADYVIWRKNEGTSNMLPNDPVGGMIGSQQYDNWTANFGKTAGSSSALSTAQAVPEPATLAMLTALAGLLVTGRRR